MNNTDYILKIKDININNKITSYLNLIALVFIIFVVCIKYIFNISSDSEMNGVGAVILLCSAVALFVSIIFSTLTAIDINKIKKEQRNKITHFKKNQVLINMLTVLDYISDVILLAVVILIFRHNLKPYIVLLCVLPLCIIRIGISSYFISVHRKRDILIIKK